MRRVVDKIKSHYFELCFIAVATFLLGFGIYCRTRGKRGTWSQSYYYSPDMFELQRYPKRESKKRSSGETECQRVLEALFGQPFPSKRPDFLRNPVTGGNRNLELDCFNEHMRLAVEYNGKQHYEYTPYFHRTKDAFYNQLYRDEMKRRVCSDNGITLIIVPYTVPVQEIETFLTQSLYTLGYNVVNW